MRRASIAVIGIFLLASCSVGEGAEGDSLTLRLGFFPNVTHAPAIVGIENGILADALGSDVVLEPHAFNAGPEVVEAIFNGALDATLHRSESGDQCVRPVERRGDSHRGWDDIGRCRARRARRHHVPGPAGRHDARDAAARKHAGRRAPGMAGRSRATRRTVEGGGDVKITDAGERPVPREAFKAGQIDGAWVSEPWATRLVQEGGGKVLVDERDLWPNERYVTTHLIVRKRSTSRRTRSRSRRCSRDTSKPMAFIE